MKNQKYLARILIVAAVFVIYALLDVFLRSKYGSLDVQVQWKMYGEQYILASTDTTRKLNTLSNDIHVHIPTLLHGVQERFQRNLLASFPLTCYPEKQGHFPSKYKTFLNTLAKYADNHATMSNNVRTLVWHCPTNRYVGGLADRLKGITFALLLAISSNRRLILDWESAAESKYFKPNLINWVDRHLSKSIKQNNAETISPHMVTLSLFEAGEYPYIQMSIKDWQGYLNIIGSNVPLVVMATNMEVSLVRNISKTNQSWLSGSFDISGLSNLTDHDLNDIIGIVSRYLFKLDKKVLEEVSKAKITLKLTNQVYAGLHLRTGFAGNFFHSEKHPKLVKDRQIWKKALQCAVSSADKYIGNDSLIFLATDSNMVKEMAIKGYGARFRTLNNYVIHIDHINNKRKLRMREKEGVLCSLVELIILAESFVQVRGSSGYSWIASLLCGPLPNKHLIDSHTCTMDNLNIIHI